MDSRQRAGQSEAGELSKWQRKLLTFVAVGDGLSDKELLKAGAVTAAVVPTFRFADWVLEGLIVALFAMMRHQGFAERSIWIVLWGINLMLSGAVLVLNDSAQIDITLMQTQRKIVNAFIRKKRWFGHFLEVVMAGRLLFWDGPDSLIIFFRQHMKSNAVLLFVLFASSGLQMYVWTKIYWFGYEGISDVVKSLGILTT